MFLLDTNVISESFAVRPEQRVVAWLASVSPGELHISAIAKAELLFGVAVMPVGRRRSDLAAMIADFLNRFEPAMVLPFATREAEAYAEIVAFRRSLGRPIRELDAQIASIARTGNLAVVTRNGRDFEHCGVVVINPWDQTP